MRVGRLRPDQMLPSSARDALSALDVRVRPDFRRAIVYGVLAVAALLVGHGLGGIDARNAHARIVVYVCSGALLIFGVLATRSAASEVSRIATAHGGAAAATPLRIACLLIGYVVVLLGVLDLLSVALGRLLVGGAVTGIIVGIAAQQTLGNVFAGLVLLFSRPYVPGERIRIRSGSAGGPLDGTVTGVGLLYTTLLTAEGVVNIPNSGLLASAVGPVAAPADPLLLRPKSRGRRPPTS
ncbi:MAG: mechanosensitive ion channel family protein [Actinomycetota bacterium]